MSGDLVNGFIKVLTEVVKTQSFTKAAENLYTSQPSISRDIKRLELEYDVKFSNLDILKCL